MKIKIKEDFGGDWITREAGEKLRKRIAIAIREREDLVLDFAGLTIASTSFFDEGFAKLAEEGISPEDYKKHVSLVNMHSRDSSLLATLCQRRKFQT